MQNKKILLPQMEIDIFPGGTQEKLLLALAGGRSPEGFWLQELVGLYPDSYVFCADKGVDYCLGNNLLPYSVVGDADSAGEAAFVRAQQLGAKVARYPREKDATDLQLLLQALPEGDVVISGIWGGRFDHLYSNVFSLAAYAQRKRKTVILADDQEIMILVRAGENLKVKFSGKKPQDISLLPLTKATKVSLQGVHWPLESKTLSMYEPYAISNCLEQAANALACGCEEGQVGLYFSYINS